GRWERSEAAGWLHQLERPERAMGVGGFRWRRERDRIRRYPRRTREAGTDRMAPRDKGHCPDHGKYGDRDGHRLPHHQVGRVLSLYPVEASRRTVPVTRVDRIPGGALPRHG